LGADRYGLTGTGVGQPLVGGGVKPDLRARRRSRGRGNYQHENDPGGKTFLEEFI